jgi:aconitate hydratase 2/2-methylisocitrate dehydratase
MTSKSCAEKGNVNAKNVMQSWADAEWFTSRPEVPESLKITVLKVSENKHRRLITSP